MNTPTAEQIRAARRHGAATSLAHLPEAARDKFMAVHQQVDARREKNINDFVSKVRAGNGG